MIKKDRYISYTNLILRNFTRTSNVAELTNTNLFLKKLRIFNVGFVQRSYTYIFGVLTLSQKHGIVRPSGFTQFPSHASNLQTQRLLGIFLQSFRQGLSFPFISYIIILHRLVFEPSHYLNEILRISNTTENKTRLRPCIFPCKIWPEWSEIWPNEIFLPLKVHFTPPPPYVCTYIYWHIGISIIIHHRHKGQFILRSQLELEWSCGLSNCF